MGIVNMVSYILFDDLSVFFNFVWESVIVVMMLKEVVLVQLNVFNVIGQFVWLVVSEEFVGF